MKILFVQPTGDKRGHYGLWTSRLCQALAQQGDDVWLFTNKINTEKFLNEPPQFKIIEYHLGKYHFDTYDKAMQNKSFLFWYGYFRNTYVIVKNALKLCKQEKFDAVFLTDVEYLVATLLLKRYRKYLPKVIWHVQAANFTYATYCGSALKKLYKTFQAKIFKSVLGREVKGFAVLGEFHKERLRDQLKLAPDFPVEVIPDGADVQKNQLSQSSARQAIKLDYTGTVFLLLGMLRKDKGVEDLIVAVSHLKAHDFKVIIAGAPFDWKPHELQALIEQYQVADKIILRLDYIPDHEMAAYYYASDAIVFPYNTHYTGSCGPLTKGACTHQKPVIVTDVSDIGRMVRKYGNGLITQPNQPMMLSKALLDFLNTSQLDRDKMANNSENLAALHSWKNVAKKLNLFLSEAHG